MWHLREGEIIPPGRAAEGEPKYIDGCVYSSNGANWDCSFELHGGCNDTTWEDF